MRCNAERLIEALIAIEMMEIQRQAAAKKQALRQRTEHCVVTVSRGFGSMGKQVGQLLADALEVRCCDRYILQEVARRAHVDEELVKVLDEHVSRIDGHWWQHLLHKKTFSYEEYYHYLVKTILSISIRGGVIIGRGANFILGTKAFRVRITGSDEQCARRVATREKIDHDSALKMVREINRERTEYIGMLYDADINDHSAYDLELNSDNYDCVQLTGMILDAMEKAGYTLPADAHKSLTLFASDIIH